MAKLAYLECTNCGEHLSADVPQNVCPRDGGSLYARYDLKQYVGKLSPQVLAGRPPTMWRYAEVLPDVAPVSLGEGHSSS